MAAARRARQQTKACDKTLLMNTSNFNFDVTGQVKLRLNSQNWTFSSMDFGALWWASLVIKTVSIVQNPSHECYMSARIKHESVEHGLESRPGHKGNVILPINESLHSRHVTRVWGGGMFKRIIRLPAPKCHHIR